MIRSTGIASFSVSMALWLALSGCSTPRQAAGHRDVFADTQPGPCNLIANGSFEQDEDPTVKIDHSFIPDWTPAIGGMAIPATGIPGGPGPRITQGGGPLLYSAPDGHWYAMLRWVLPIKVGDTTFSGASSISQPISQKLKAGAYKLEFSEAAYPANPAGSNDAGDFQTYGGSIEVQIASSTPGSSVTPQVFTVLAKSHWKKQTWLIKHLDEGYYTIKFLGYQSPDPNDTFANNHASFVDAVVFCKQPASGSSSTTQPAD